MDHFLIFLGFPILIVLNHAFFGGQFSPIQSARPCQLGQFVGLVYAENVSGNPWCLIGKGVLQMGGPKPRVKSCQVEWGNRWFIDHHFLETPLTSS